MAAPGTGATKGQAMNKQTDLVELCNISKSFDNFRALDDISLTIRRGEFFSLLGPSGCGKSTLLRLLAGLEWPDHGEIFIDDRNMSGVPAHKRPCNMVFQSYAIFPHLSVSDNIAYGLRRFGLSKTERRKRVDEMIATVGLEGLGGRNPDQLSGGQAQRVALARALVRQPKVLLLDEPLGALDKTLREQMQVELRQLQRSVGITFVFVTHDQEEALSMSDRIAVMAAGRVLQIATPIEIYERPNCAAVAGFIGDMNFLTAITETVKAAGQVLVKVEGLGEIVFDEQLESDQPGLSHRVAIRPEKLLVTNERTDADICVSGTVESSSYWGDQSQYQVSIDGCDTPLMVASHNLDPLSSLIPVRGSQVWLSVNSSALLRFSDAAS